MMETHERDRREEERRGKRLKESGTDPSPSHGVQTHDVTTHGVTAGLRNAVAYPGPVGSHTASAAAALFPSAELVPLAGFRAVADAVAAMEVPHGVLPIESSLVGPVAETHDLLYERDLSIVAETVQPIVHCLAGPAPIDLARIRVVRSHPMAIDQCRDLLGRLPQAAVIPVSTTAEAAKLAAEELDPTHVAIVGHSAAELYGLHVLEDDIGDHTA
jgi:prephenate dehydratase